MDDEEKEYVEKLSTIGENVDLHLPHQEGNQPIRVLNNLVLFRLIHEDIFISELFKWAVLQKGLKPHVKIIYGDVPLRNSNTGKFRTPRVDQNKELTIHETFLSIIWMLSYVIFVYYCDKYEHPKIHKLNPQQRFNGFEERLDIADELFAYCKQLIVDFEEWSKKELPNPELYLVKELDYIGQTKIFYSEAVKFILYHELVHVSEHIDIVSNSNDSEILEFEKDADKLALEIILKLGNAPRYVSECGAVIGILTNFIVTPYTKAKRHPNLEDRLKSVLDKCVNDIAYGFACVGIELWADQFDILLVKPNEGNYRIKFEDYYDQLKQMD